MDDKVTQVCWSPDDTTKSFLIRCPILSLVDSFVFAVLGFDLNLTNFSLAMNPFIIPEITIKKKTHFLWYSMLEVHDFFWNFTGNHSQEFTLSIRESLWFCTVLGLLRQ